MVDLILQVCPVCSDKSYPYFSHSDIEGNEATLFKCINCGHGSYNNQYSSEYLSQVYHQSYADDYTEGTTDAAKLRSRQYESDVKTLLEFHPFSDSRVLDIGCSNGGFLDAMPISWDKSGFEINPIELDFLKRERTSYRIYGNLLDIEDTFNLITLRGVIEHIPDHAILLKFLKDHLEQNGGVFISATPDFASVSACLYKEQWSLISCPEHIHQFSGASLSILLAKAGLVLKSIYHPYLDTPYANWESDRNLFLDNYKGALGSKEEREKVVKHPFPGNMMTAFFMKL